MALIVEDGTGLANAESYISVAAADAYHASRGNAVWEDLDPDVKEQNLRRATDFIDAHYSEDWSGETTTLEQALAWPRGYVPRPVRETYPGGSAYDPYLSDGAVPPQVAKATAILALKVATGVILAPSSSPAVKQETIGPLTTIYQDGAGDALATLEMELFEVENLLRGLIGGRSSTVRLIRG